MKEKNFKRPFFISFVSVIAGAILGLSAFAADDVEVQSLVVKPGDTLWSISNRYLKDPARWNEILKHNKLPSSDPTVALPGMTLRVPVRLIREDLRAAHLVYRLNKVLFRRKETAEWKQTSEKMELYRNDSLRTLDQSKARVRFLNEDMLQLDANSMAIIKPVNKDYDVELKRGGVFVGKAKVLTASAKITPKTRDTKYAATVRNDLSTLVEVYTGKAAVEAEGQSVDVGPGMATEVKMGLAPSLPSKIADLPDFEARAAEFEGDPRALRSKAAVVAIPAPAKINLAAPEAGSLKTEVDNQRVGEPISGFRVQFAAGSDFSQPLFDKNFDADMAVRPADVRLPAGRYWVRVALIDLLGVQGRFSPAKLYYLSASSLRQVKDLRSRLTLLRPSSDEVTETSPYRVMGRANDSLTVMVNGNGVRLDGDGNFSIMLPLAKGDNIIRVNIVDDAGNTDYLVRKIVYRPQTPAP